MNSIHIYIYSSLPCSLQCECGVHPTVELILKDELAALIYALKRLGIK